MKPPPSTDEQIVALLTGNGLRLTQEWTGKTEPTGNEYAEVFTVAVEDVHKYVQEKGLPPGPWKNRPHTHDGLYMVENEGMYRVYYQERGTAFDERTYASRAEAERALTEWLLGMSGTGLYVSGAQGAGGGAPQKLLTKLKSTFGLR